PHVTFEISEALMRRTTLAFVAGLGLAACGTPAPRSPGTSGPGQEPLIETIGRLPTGKYLDPAGPSVKVGSLPLAMTLSPDGSKLVLLLNGWREQGVQVVDRASGKVTQTALLSAAFLGLAFSPDGRTLYVSGGNQDVVYRYDWSDDWATLRDSLVLAVKQPNRSGTRYPAQLALSPDGRFMYVAENLADSVAVVDLASGQVLARHATERYPYGVAVGPDGTVYVSAWGGHTVSVFRFADDGSATVDRRVPAGRHPSALLLNHDGTRLFVASGSTDRVTVLDTKAMKVVAQLDDNPPAGPHEGSTPNALALSPDGRRLFVAEADNNAVAVFDLGANTAGVADSGTEAPMSHADQLAGRIPVEWYPTALAVRGDTLFAANGKGQGTQPNPDFPQPPIRRAPGEPNYTMGQLTGTVSELPLVRATDAALATLSARVARANGWGDHTERRGAYPAAIKHVMYIIKENRTYDQVFGDLPSGDGDPSLVFFPRAIGPNHHALAERFGIFDRFFVNAEASPDGHNWSMAAYTTDYLQKTVPSNYSERGRSYDYEGTNRGFGHVPWEEGNDDVNEPANGYLWNLAQDAGITFRNFGEFVVPEYATDDDRMPSGYRGDKPFLMSHTSKAYPGFDLKIQDQKRADVWIQELQGYVQAGAMPALQILRLPNDHTAGGSAGSPTPEAYFADNDLALGRIVEALSKTQFWQSTVIFIVEDDSQNGPDHVDSHRAPFLVISPWVQPGVHHRWTNTTDVIATMTEILDLGSLSQFDYYGRPLRDIWRDHPDTSPYTALKPLTPLDQKNPSAGPDAEASRALDLRFEDSGQDDLFNRILWSVIKGHDVPYPGINRMSALEWKRGR
ncbi:MAG: beta-propeller fold lactonase family protein, partial [Gemmatimonadetes bacterium]|nr:beta-propeller fold lactonase family protein [Gemmatimonadota bacterium]